MAGYRRRESKAHRNRMFGPTADKVNVRNVRVRNPRGGRSL